ncbi:hypothetical protein [Nitrobacter sp.]|uniref:hypothetical protein n=1 Tax=Nitrobacter sp. TaxID=29420 RepID=UPI001D2A45B0|nr:hypothetical protein [Nitrobacter sp.]MCB1392884.1 hypothetical protein [Nitrobacter sp.]
MTRQEQLDLIRAACIEANPSDTTLRDKNSWQGLQIKREYGRPVRLADVLLALEQSGDPQYAVNTTGEFMRWGDTPTGIRWNLRKDDLAEQSDECVAFLAELLAKH